MPELTQRSMEWRELRAGHVTASRFKAVLTSGRSQLPWAPKWLGATAGTYMTQLLFEMATGQFADRGETVQMRYGVEWEEEARQRAQMELWRHFKGDVQLPVGAFAYIQHPDHARIGCSPDGLIGEDGLLELKCPYDGARHAQAILTGDWLENEHRAQIQGSLWITGRRTYYVGSYDHRYESRRLHLVEVERDEQFIESELEPSVLRFRGLLLELFEKHFQRTEVEVPF